MPTNGKDQVAVLLEQIAATMTEAIEDAYKRGDEHGEARGRRLERERIASALPAFLSSLSKDAQITEAAGYNIDVVAITDAAADHVEANRGGISKAVRDALNAMPFKYDGYEAADIVAFSKAPLKVEQVRDALKAMEGKQVRRVARGKYLPGRIMRPGSDAGTPNPGH